MVFALPTVLSIFGIADELFSYDGSSDSLFINMPQIPQALTETDILTRIVVHPECGNPPQEVSRLILGLQFKAQDISRMNELEQKNNLGQLSEAECQEREKYLRVVNFLNLLRAKAELSLNNSSN
jgi:hypothetical protein